MLWHFALLLALPYTTALLPTVSFSACPATPTPASTWNFSGGPQQSGVLQWGGNASLCLIPQGCSSADGTPAVLAPCAAAAACSSWLYDTFTSFTLTCVATGNELTSAGSSGANATVAAPMSSPTQQFVVNSGAISPASDTTLCLAAGPSQLAPVPLQQQQQQQQQQQPGNCSLEPYDLRVGGLAGARYTGSAQPLLSWRLRLAPGADASRSALQGAYRLLAGASAAAVAAGELYDSGWQPSNATLGLPYAGLGLSAAGDSIFWGVQVQDSAGAASALVLAQQPLTLAPAPERPGDWGGAQWVTHNATLPGSDCACYSAAENPVPVLRLAFALPTSSRVAAAHLFVGGLGLQEAFLSGHRVGAAGGAARALLPENATGFGLPPGSPGAGLGDEVLNPPWTTYTRHILFSAYEVRGLLAGGGAPGAQQTLGLLLGRGMWDPLPMRFFGSPALNFRQSLAAVGRPQAIAHLLLVLEDGSRVSVRSSAAEEEGWAWAPGPLTANNIYLGEEYDSELGGGIAGWMQPGYNASAWAPVQAADAYRPGGELLLNPAPPARITQALAPLSITPLPSAPPGTAYILAFQENIAGWLSFAGLPEGAERRVLRLTFGELLNDTSGDVDTRTTLAGCIGCWEGQDPGPCAPAVAEQSSVLALGGGGSSSSYTPKFHWAAFRYVRLEGWDALALGGPPPLSAFTALRLHVDNPPAGAFADSTPAHAAVDALVSASLRSNWAGGIQSDCPGRERLGYGGDLLASAEAALLQYDVAPFYAKRVQDYVDSASPAGQLPETAPYIGIDTCAAQGGGNMQWGAALTELQRLLLRYAADLPLARAAWPASLAWLTFLNASASPAGLLANGLVDGFFTHPWETACVGQGSMAPLMGTAYFARQCSHLAALAAAVGRPEEGLPWAARSEQARAAFRAAFVDEATGLVGSRNGSAGGPVLQPSAADAQVWALGCGVFPRGSALEAAAAQQLAARLASNGSAALLGALANSLFYSQAQEWTPAGGDPARGLADAAYAALDTAEYPGYGFMLARGAVTLWEHLNTAWESTSHNHAWYGSVAVFLRRVIGGIGPAPAALGFDRVLIHPIPPRLPSATSPAFAANASYGSVRGEVATAWRLAPAGQGGVAMQLLVTLPPNVAATVQLPLLPPVAAGWEWGPGGAPPLPLLSSTCALLPAPQLDTAAGVARWDYAGYTGCAFSAVWGSGGE
jgi:alpha-L-rhamnosidase